MLIDPDTKPAQRIQAARVLGQVTEVAAFTELKQVTHVNGSDEIKAQIMNQLKGLMLSAGSNGDVMDVDANELLAELSSSDQDDAPETESDPENVELERVSGLSEPHRTPTQAENFGAEPARIHTIPHKVSPTIIESEISGNPPMPFANGDGEGGIKNLEEKS